MRQLVLIFLLSLGLSAKTITPNEVYAQVELIKEEMHFLLKYFGIKHEHKKIIESTSIQTPLKPRNVWQKSYEIFVKINILRNTHDLPMIEPINMEPVLKLNPDLVYENTQRKFTEIKIFKYRQNIKSKKFELKIYKNKSPMDVYNALAHISASFDELNGIGFTPSYVFGETMRIYDDLTTILQHLNIEDNTIPSKRNDKSTPADTFSSAMKILSKIRQIQFSVGIDRVDFSGFVKENPSPSDVFTMTQMILAELQPIKAYVGLNHYITPAATFYTEKIPADVDQLMNWNFRKVSLIESFGGKLR